MKKIYNQPEIEIVILDQEDITTTSGNVGNPLAGYGNDDNLLA